MKHALRTYLQKPQTLVGIVVALMAQLIFCIVWMTAYDGVTERADQLKIAVVNQDGAYGEQLEQQLAAKVPFRMVLASKESAADQLAKREVHLVLTIPAGFGESLKEPGMKAKLQAAINESNPQMTKSMMQAVAGRVTNELNQQAAMQGATAVLEQMNLPAEQAAQTAEGMLNKVEADMTFLNPVQGMNNQMVPMMLVLASYVGAMLMAMNLHQVYEAIGSRLSKKQHMGVRLVIVPIGALVISITGSLLIHLFGGQMTTSFVLFWLFHFLTVLTFMFLAQMFLMVFGMAGMFVNMTMLSLQLVTSGTVVPRQMLSSFYQALGDYLPATYAVEGLMNLQFGGIDTGRDVGILLVIGAVSLGMIFLMALWKKQPAPLSADHAPGQEAAA